MAREPDMALLMAAFVKKYVKICPKMLKIWLSQPKRFPTPALNRYYLFRKEFPLEIGVKNEK